MGFARGGVCECGRAAVASCVRCNRSICQVHADAVPTAPSGVSADAAGRFSVAARTAAGAHCEHCRTELGQYALSAALSAPRTPLPDHWLDRAIALSSDNTRSALEKAEDAGLPAALTAAEVAAEFLRRIDRQPRERVPVSPGTILRAPDYVEGWTVDCRRTDYVPRGTRAARYRLPCLISVHGELLGPILEGDRSASATWWVVPESDIDLPRLVASVANLLMLSEYSAAPPS
jgi:hypothetical protein